MTDPYRPGEPVVLRHVRGIWKWAAPVRVVEDRGDFVALYLQPGSRCSTMAQHDGARTRNFVTATRQVPSTWGINHALHLVRFGDEHATVLYWAEDTWELRCWYVNFQEPLRRVSVGFESMDLTLDLVVAPDFASWAWKDEDEFVDIGIAGGWYTHDQLAHLKAHGARVLEAIGAREPPFNEPWPQWRPDPSWTPLSLPEGWDA